MSKKEKIKTIGRKNVKRLQSDIIDIIKNPLAEHGIHYIHDDEDILKGYAVVFGPSDSIYRYGCYSFRFDFPTEYPYKPPKLTYLTNDGETRFHPNLYRNGKVCISILHEGVDQFNYESISDRWKPIHGIISILMSIILMLAEPNLESPANVNASKLYRDNIKKFNDFVHKTVQISQKY